MTSLLDRPITAASDDGVCCWHAVKLWQTHAIKYENIEIKFDLHHKLRSKSKTYWNLDYWFEFFLNLKNLSSAGKKTARFLLAGACDSYVPYVRCVERFPRDKHTRHCRAGRWRNSYNLPILNFWRSKRKVLVTLAAKKIGIICLAECVRLNMSRIKTRQEIWANAHETRHIISLISYAGCLGLSPVYFSENLLKVCVAA